MSEQAAAPALSGSQRLPSLSPTAETSSFQASRTRPADNFVLFPVEHGRGRPGPFKPDGSFKVLKETGKLSEGKEQSSWWDDSNDDGSRTRNLIPGYTGHVRGRRQISGRTAGAATNRALTVDFREIAVASPIPSAPSQNRKIPQATPADTFITNTFHGKVYHIPGYSGHVPNVRATFAQTYGTVTSDEMAKFRANADGYRADVPGRDFGQDGYAKTLQPRQFLTLDSQSLPGGARTVHPPELLIPSHIRYLRFLAQ